jgi:hypothetical protein
MEIITHSSKFASSMILAGVAASMIAAAAPAVAAPNDGRAPKPGGNCTGANGQPIEAGGQSVEQSPDGTRVAQYCRQSGMLCTYIKIPSATGGGSPLTDKSCTGKAQG